MAANLKEIIEQLKLERDIIRDGAGALDEDLSRAIDAALACDRGDAASLGARYSWATCTAQFVSALTFVPADRTPEGKLENVGLAA